MHIKSETIFVLVWLVQSISCANILYVAPLASPSHHLWNSVLAKELVNKGHNITMLTHDLEKGSTPRNYTLILMEAMIEIRTVISECYYTILDTVLTQLKQLGRNEDEDIWFKRDESKPRRPYTVRNILNIILTINHTNPIDEWLSMYLGSKGIYDILREHYDFEAAIEANSIGKMKGLYDYVKFSCEYDLNTKGLDTLLNYPKDYKFDLIIFDVTFGQCLYPLIQRFHNPPAIAVTAFMLPPVLSNAFGNHQYASYVPYPFTIYSEKMTLMERSLNFLYTNMEILYRDYISASTEFNLYKKKFGENVSPPAVFEKRISLFLANINPALDYIVPLPPNIIPIGGLQIRPTNALPTDLQRIMDSAKNGVILFSLGTNLLVEDLKPFQLKALLESFAKLSQTILWKVNSGTLEGLPKNVIIRKWLPQNDVLGHPNTKLFISHGGAMSTQEATYNGVPVVGIPFFMDQYANIQKLARRKLAIPLDLKTMTTDGVYNAIYEVLNNPVYKQNMKKISKQFRDQPETPLERGVFWVEYVLRHGGAEHLVLPARDMPFYQTSNLDVMAVFAFIIIAVYLLVSFIIRYCLGLSRGIDLDKKVK